MNPTRYRTGHCQVGGHNRCNYDYTARGGATCACPCHDAPLPAVPAAGEVPAPW